MRAPLARVGDLAEQIRGVTYAKGDASVEPRDGYVPILRAGNISDEGLTLADFVFVPPARVSERQFLRRNDVLVAASSGSLDVVGKAALVTSDPGAAFGAFCKVLRPREKVHPGYFAHFFKTPAYRNRVSALAAGANINNLRNEDLDDLTLPFPSFTEQRRIAEILDRAEALRAKRRAALAQVDGLTQAIFLEMFGDPVTNPRQWKAIGLRDLLAVPLRNGVSPSKSGKVVAKVLTLSAVTGGEFDPTAFKTSTFETQPPEDQSVDDADFLICRGNGNAGLVGKGYFPTSRMRDVTFPDTMIAARVDQERLEPRFVESVWSSRAVRRQIEAMARTTNGTFKINQAALERVELMLPPRDLQRSFARRAAAVDKLKAAHRASLTQLDALFASLQHLAFRGEL